MNDYQGIGEYPCTNPFPVSINIKIGPQARVDVNKKVRERICPSGTGVQECSTAIVALSILTLP
jgi:hypothetical protein